MQRRTGPLAAAVLVLLAIVVPTAAGVAAPVPPPAGSAVLAVTTVSNPRPDMISGDRVLTRVTLPAATEVSSVRVTLDGREVTKAFVPSDDTSLLGLVTGLRLGRQVLRVSARVAGRLESAATTVVDHPSSGPVFSGPQQTPFFCRTGDAGLGPARSASCDAPTQVTYRYVSVRGRVGPLSDPRRPPRDVATARFDGRAVPFVVRIEQGVVNRAVYQFVALSNGSEPDPTASPDTWNGRLVFSFGGGCNAGYQQGVLDGSGTGPDNVLFLRQGYAIATSTLNILGNACSTVLSAETAMMVKERFVDTYGPVTHTIGWGGSGGGIAQLAIADAYPGILDGIVPAIPFPDVPTPIDVVGDCRLLDRFFGQDPARGSVFSPSQQAAVSGFARYESCSHLDRALGTRLQATASCGPVIPESSLWDPVSRPGGVSCSAAAANRTQLGTDPDTGLPRSFVDNVGVQYGLQALLDGQISPQQFASLNAAMGGFDASGEFVAARSAASPEALQATYADDLLVSGGLGLRTTPVIDLRQFLDDADDESDIHTVSWSYVIRARLAASGVSGGAVLLETGVDSDGQKLFALRQLDRWLDALGAASARTPETVAAARPATLSDGCFLGASDRLVREDLTDGGDGPCAAAYPVASNPRLVAGEPLAMSTLKCVLRPLDPDAYPGVRFTPVEWADLRTAFPTGVCDWSQPGVAQQAPLGPWLRYGNGE